MIKYNCPSSSPKFQKKVVVVRKTVKNSHVKNRFFLAIKQDEVLMGVSVGLFTKYKKDIHIRKDWSLAGK